MNDPRILDPRYSRLAIKLHELAEAIDAVEHQAGLLDPGTFRANVETSMIRSLGEVIDLQRDLEYEAKRT